MLVETHRYLLGCCPIGLAVNQIGRHLQLLDIVFGRKHRSVHLPVILPVVVLRELSEEEIGGVVVDLKRGSSGQLVEVNRNDFLVGKRVNLCEKVAREVPYRSHLGAGTIKLVVELQTGLHHHRRFQAEEADDLPRRFGLGEDSDQVEVFYRILKVPSNQYNNS